MKTNNDDWITIKPNGEENKGKHLLLKEGETPKEAIKRTWGVDLDKKKQSESAGTESQPAEKSDEKQQARQTIYDLQNKYMTFVEQYSLKKQGVKQKDIDSLADERNAILGTLYKVNYNDDDIGQQVEQIKKRLSDWEQKKADLLKEAQEKKEKKATATKKRAESGKFDILQETDKAYLIQQGGRQAWIPKVRISKSGDLTEAGKKIFEQEAKSSSAVEKENAEREKGLELPSKANYESDKAYGYDIPITVEKKQYSLKTHDWYYPLETKSTRIFIPKSMVKDGRIPTWLLEKKIEEAESKFFIPGDDFEPRQHAKIKSIWGKSTYDEGNRRKIAFTEEYTKDIKPDPDFEDNHTFEIHAKDSSIIKVGNHALKIGNVLLCKVKNKYLAIYNENGIK